MKKSAYANVLEGITAVGIFTGSNGKKGCTSNCSGCFMTTYGKEKPMFQGTMEQIEELSFLLPNLKRVGIFGNPDISVDPEFCNEAAKYFQRKGGIELGFWTSGIGGAITMEKLLKDLDPKVVAKVDFTVETLDETKLQKLKGVKITLDKIKEGIITCQNMGFKAGVKSPIWPLNMHEDWEALRDYFRPLGVERYTAHFGSLDCDSVFYEHVPPEEIRRIVHQDFKIGNMSPLVLLDEELDDYVNNYVPYCSKPPVIINAFLEKDGIKASSLCPSGWTSNPQILQKLSDYTGDVISKSKICPAAERAMRYKLDKKYHAVCRFYNPWKS